MKNYLTLLILVLMANLSYGLDREIRETTPFHTIHVGGGIDLHIYVDDEYKIEIESVEPEDIITEIDGNVLKVHYRSGWSIFDWNRDDKVYVYLPDLEEVVSSGGSDVRGEDEIKGDFLVLRASGGSDINLRLDVRDLEVSSSGGSDIILTGTARFINAESSGGSDIKAYDLTAEEADVHSSGGSDIYITVEKKIKARASGGSDVYYQGDPQYVDIDSGSGGDVHRR